MTVRRTALFAALALLVPTIILAEETAPGIDLSRPLTSDECVRLALERNYLIRQASDRQGIQDANELAAWGGIVPDLTLGYDYQHAKSTFTQDPGSTFAPFPNITDSDGYFISARQTLLSFPVIFNIVASKRYSGATDEEVRSAEQTAAKLVRDQYYNLIEAIKLAEVTLEDQKLADEELKRTQSLFDVGSVARTDVLKSNVRIYEARAALTTANNRVIIERSRLNQALALPPDAPVQVVESLDPTGELPDSADAYAEAFANRPDLKAARLRLAGASADKKSALGGKLPYISHAFNRNFTESRGDDRTFSIDNEGLVQDTTFVRSTSNSWSYRIGIGINLLDGLVTESNMQRAKYQALLAEHQMLDLENAVYGDVREALVLMQNATAQIQTAREARTSAEEDLKLSQERYTVGLGTILELIDAQVNVSRARTGEVQAMAALKRAEAELDRSLGRENW